MRFLLIRSHFPVLHPVGNIAEFLLGAGLAHLVEWHSGMLAPYGGSEKLRAADRSAREKRLGLHANAPLPSAISKSLSGAPNGAARALEGTVVRVWSGDQVSILAKDGKERRVQLSSTRGPKYVCPVVILATC
jgi:staphylococcal nuclease domain-containing protein 1